MIKTTTYKRVLVACVILIVMTVISVDFLTAFAAGPASPDVNCYDAGYRCPREYDGCDSCTTGWKIRYAERERWNCEDGSYVCEFLGYSYGPCGSCPQ